MSVFIDRDFLTRISPQLQRFVKKKDDLYNFRCPICGDSQKNNSLARGFIYRKNDNYVYKCHNCSISLNFYSFLEKVDADRAKEYVLEKFKKEPKEEKEIGICNQCSSKGYKKS